MKADCKFYYDCRLPCELCNDDCEDYESEGVNPLEEEENKGCAELHFKKDMGEI